MGKWKRVQRSTESVKLLDAIKQKIMYDPLQDGITQSLLCQFLRCRRAFVLSILGWQSIEKKLTHANGTITHDILDKCYTYYVAHNALPNKVQIKKWIDSYDTDHPDWMPGKQMDLIGKYKMVCYTMIIEYLNFYNSQGEFTKRKVLGAEDIFDLQYKGMRLRGKKDLRYLLIKANENWILETKTMARIIETDIISRLQMDPQCLLYTIAEELEFGYKCSGVCYNIIRNPGHKVGASESLQQYCNRLKAEIRKDPNHFFKRFYVPFTAKDKMEFKLELMHKVNEMKKITDGHSYPYKNETACVNNFNCHYLPACSSGNLNGYVQDKILFKELQ